MGEGHRLFSKRSDPAVRHGPASDVAGEIDEHAFSVIVAGLDVDIPLLPPQFVLQVLPLLKVCGGRKNDHALSNGIVHVRKELSPEYGHDCANREEVAFMTCVFPSVINKTSFGDQAVEVGMEDHGLAPGMESCDDARLCTKVLGVEEELEKGIPHAGKEEGGHAPDVLKPDLVEFMGDGEYQVIMTAGKKPFLLPFQPLGDLRPLALRAEAMAAGVVPVSLIVAFRTGFHMAAQFGGSADHERTGCLPHMIG